MSAWPGAMTSGLMRPSYHVGPRELNFATSSSSRLALALWRAAPIVSADGALPGDVTPAKPTSPVSGFMPMLPADTTTTMPARTARSTACTIGSVAAGS
jgi:hypothetical protein